ncbi:hypothetical protein Tco_0624520 [Tanacetum coccineum]|uniref:Uncharacterized protein n=1 Tax=Tanacetum coccineum TaxID=301880 RepID=A0ABQ4WE95_9ASTR
MKKIAVHWEESEKFLHDTIAAPRGFYAEQRATCKSGINLLQELILYEKVKRFDESFTAVGSTEDERRIKEMNEGCSKKKGGHNEYECKGKRKSPQPDSSPEVGVTVVIHRANSNYQCIPLSIDDNDGIPTEDKDQSDFWSDQQDWKIVTWRLYEACGVYILELEDVTVIHMLVEKRYPYSKDLLSRMH